MKKKKNSRCKFQALKKLIDEDCAFALGALLKIGKVITFNNIYLKSRIFVEFKFKLDLRLSFALISLQ